MTASSQQPEGPASLDPRSPGCILTAVALAAAAVAGWLGLRLLEANSGEMALAAARRGVTTSGLAAPTQALLEAELVRIEEAHLAERLEPAEVIAAVDGLLQTPCLPWLRLRQVRDLDLPASGLADPDRARLARDLDDLELMLRQGAITSGQASEVLGLQTVEGGTAVVGDDGRGVDGTGCVEEVLGRAKHRGRGGQHRPGRRPAGRLGRGSMPVRRSRRSRRIHTTRWWS